MLEQFTRALTGSHDAPTLQVQRLYATTAADLWDALTNLERVARWLGHVAGEPSAVGDAFSVSPPEAPDQAAVCRIMSCTPNERLVVEWRWQDDLPSRITALLEPDGERTRLTLVHALQTPDADGDTATAWEQCLAMLGEVLGDAASDPNRVEATARATWRNLSAHVLELEWALPATPDVVWRAFTTDTGLRAWWWNHWSDVEFALDVRPGGTYRILAPCAEIAVEGEYLVVDAPRHLAFTWRWIDATGVSRDEACDLRFEADADGAGTRLFLRHSGPWADRAPAETYRQGWEFTVGALAKSLAESSLSV